MNYRNKFQTFYAILIVLVVIAAVIFSIEVSSSNQPKINYVAQAKTEMRGCLVPVFKSGNDVIVAAYEVAFLIKADWPFINSILDKQTTKVSNALQEVDKLNFCHEVVTYNPAIPRVIIYENDFNLNNINITKSQKLEFLHQTHRIELKLYDWAKKDA